MKKADAMHAITKAYTILFRDIEYVEELKPYNMTVSDFYTACEVMQELRTPGSSSVCFIETVSAFFKNCGFDVKPDEHGVNYIISC